MITIDQERLLKLVEEYKADFKENIPLELYKWEAVKHFQDNWDLDAEDFPAMLSRSLSKTENLLASMSNFAKGMIVQFAERFPEEVKELFSILFDETLDLKERIESFTISVKQIHAKWDGKEAKSHFQTPNAISTYLWLRFPDRYYIFKPTVAKRMFEKLCNDTVKTNEVDGIVKTYELYDSISEVLRKDEELKGMLSSALTNNCYPDLQMKTAIVDFAYFFSKSHIVKRHMLRKFLEVFPYETLSTMPIEQYTNLKKTSFCYWLEQETSELGSISGATSFKFGIYRYYKSVADSKKDYGYDEQYAWYKAYGENADEAYSLVRDSIVQIATLAKEGKYEEIDMFEKLGTLVKWKIAFIYSNASLIPVFSRDMLEYCAKKFGMENTQNATFAEMQRYLLNKKGNIEIFQWYEFYKVVEEYKKQGDLKELFDAVQKNIDEEYKVTKRSKRFAWIETNDSVIGNSKCHYELCADENNKAGHIKGHIYVEAHFETDESSLFQSLKEIEGVSDFPWGPKAKHYAVRINNDGWEINKYDTKELADILIEEIIKLDNAIGNNIRQILNGKRYWTYSPNSNASKWELCQKLGIICIGWSAMGDLSKIKNLEECRNKLREVFNTPTESYTNDGLAIWEFSHIMNIGDIVYATQGKDKIIGRGIVDSEYFYDTDTDEYRHRRKIKWTHIGQWTYVGFSTKTLTDVTPYTDWVKELEKRITEANKNMYDTKYLPFINLLLNNRNLILNGAPGTGKTYLAKQVAAQIIYGGDVTESFEEDANFIEQCGFVQFHPSYDYTDFVEGLRPKNDNGNIGFERKDGTFKEFCAKALQNLLDSKKTVQTLQNELSVRDLLEGFINESMENETMFETSGTKNAFYIIDNKEKSIIVRIPANEKTSEVSLPKSDLTTLLENKVDIKGGGDIQTYFGRKYRTQPDSYVYVLYNELVKKAVPLTKTKSVAPVSEKKFVFIIDEINRGEISKIFGELFFSVDPGYRGVKGKVQTQYQNLITEDDPFKDGFYIPENVYIIGTMNDIDRSVECMDFAMRRRFTFKEITAEESASNMELGTDATERMMSLNNAISEIDGFNSSFHIGAAYFKGVDDFDALWELKLAGLLKEYLRGMPDAEESLEALKKAYYLSNE